jgi:hypothetical protein
MLERANRGRGFVDAANGCFAEENANKRNAIAGSRAWHTRHNPQDGKLWLRDIKDMFVAITKSRARSW